VKVILKVQKINVTEFTPSGDADKVNLKYTDWAYKSGLT
jgi:hypothetical protein